METNQKPWKTMKPPWKTEQDFNLLQLELAHCHGPRWVCTIYINCTLYNVCKLYMLCWCMSRGFLWAGVAAFPCHQQSHLQGEVSLPLPAPSSNSFKCRTFEQNLDPLETILWQFWRLSWVLCIFLQHNFQYVPLDPPELISTLVIHMWKNAKLLGDNFGTLQKKRRFILRGISWIGTFSGLLSLWGQM